MFFRGHSDLNICCWKAESLLFFNKNVFVEKTNFVLKSEEGDEPA